MADPSTSPPLTCASVQDALKLIEPYIHKTPVLTNTTLSTLASTPRTPAELEGTPWAGCTPAKPVLRLWFKCENFQRIGAFKIRGAFHAIERLKREPAWAENGGREKGVVTHSSGNHAQALALAARENNIPAYIVMPTISAAPKIAATKGYGAHVIFSGSTSVERHRLRLTPPSHLPANRTPRSTQSSPPTGIRVFGAEPSHEGADARAPRRTRIERVTSLTIADGLRTPVGVYPWSVIYERRLVSGMYSVSETQIVAALRLVYERCKIVVEPSAVVGLAVALYNEDFRAMVEKEAGDEGWDLGVVFSGGNVSLEALGKLFSG
ncbi:tryptophan synthase beta subunit-like PLP-dependent enzyme [Mycena leptocephala]|nr:tryptophan synthase beta subunit-like PLP-dependent enzyme [Mycena leptocephala]